eukprot:NODE_35_length_31537_cov_0.293403.p4 type:complete len:651 gc:universal NODE_35_length_31537_cov_0.293403:21471-19519(-)
MSAIQGETYKQEMSVRFNAMAGPLTDGVIEEEFCYLLEIDHKQILLDVGKLPDGFDCRSIDAVVLSHSGLPFIKDLPKLSKLGYTGPIYATLPTLYFSRMALLDYYDGDELIKEIEHCYHNAINVSYMQPVKIGEIEIVAYNSSHSPGGAFYKISFMANDFLYCININHKREKTLNPSDLFSGGSVSEIFSKPTCLITNLDVFSYPEGNKKERESKMVNSVINALRKKANVLLPVDATSRLFEVLYILDNAWSQDYDIRKKQYCKHPLFFLAKNAKKWIQYGKGMLESFSDALSSEFATTRKHPFEFRFVKVIEDIEKLPRGPYVVVTIDKDCNDVFGRELAFRYVQADSAIILTSLPSENSFTRLLMDNWSNGQTNYDEMALRHVVANVNYEYTVNTPLEGAELQKYYQEEQQRREELVFQQQIAHEKKKKRKKLKNSNEDLADEDTMEIDDQSSITELTSEEDDSDDLVVKKEHFRDIQLEHFSKTHDLWVYDSDVNRMFPYTEYPLGIPTISFKDSLLGKRKFDEYGIIIDTSKYENKSILPTVLEDEEEEIVQEVLYVPSKQEKRELKTRAKFFMLYVDLMGLSDGQSMLTIFQQLEPKKMILIHGPNRYMEEIKADVKTAEIVACNKDEWIEITSAGNVVNVFYK